MYRAADRLDPEAYLALARATYAEMALAGVTTVGEFHYVHHGPGGVPYEDPNQMGRALIAAAAEAGVRITLLDCCYLHGGIGEPPSNSQRRFSDRGADAWAERVEALEEAESVRVGAAIHSMRAVDPDSAAAVAGWACERGRPLHAHVSEQPAENEACMEAHGRTPTALLSDAGALEASFTAVHATHLDDADVALLGEAGACCCACPTTERDLADGIGAMRRLVDAGASLSLGTDSHAVIDLFEEARAVELDERLASGERGRHDAAALLRAATTDGHACLGWPDAGRIEPGARADLVTVALDGVRLSGTEPENALDAVVFAAGAADVRHVLVDGRELVADGRHATVDVARELHTAVLAVVA
jgi:formiminoglutamate deiminase